MRRFDFTKSIKPVGIGQYRDSGRREKVPAYRRKIPVHLAETFASRAHFQVKSSKRSDLIMKHIVPLFLALIPLVAVVGACVAVP